MQADKGVLKFYRDKACIVNFATSDIGSLSGVGSYELQKVAKVGNSSLFMRQILMLRLKSLKQHLVHSEARVHFHSGVEEMEKRKFEKREEKAWISCRKTR